MKQAGEHQRRCAYAQAVIARVVDSTRGSRASARECTSPPRGCRCTVSETVKAVGLIVFLAILKELPITLLLGGATGAKPLAFRIWDRYSEALWHDAGLSGLILLLLALSISFVILKERI